MLRPRVGPTRWSHGVHSSDAPGGGGRLLVRGAGSYRMLLSGGGTIEETLSNSKEAIEAHLMAVKENLHDLSVIADRKGDRCISLEELKRSL